MSAVYCEDSFDDGMYLTGGSRMRREKEEVLEFIRRMPDDVTADQIMEELYFRQQVEKGLQDVASGQVLTHNQLRERIQQWRSCAGR